MGLSPTVLWVMEQNQQYDMEYIRIIFTLHSHKWLPTKHHVLLYPVKLHHTPMDPYVHCQAPTTNTNTNQYQYQYETITQLPVLIESPLHPQKCLIP